ncbi:MAG: hypothetical protein U0586_15595 [Candidatus Brocadiaceae bacterium]
MVEERKYYRKGNTLVVQYPSKHANMVDLSLGRDAEWLTYTTEGKGGWSRLGYTKLTEEEAMELLAKHEVLPSEEEIE